MKRATRLTTVFYRNFILLIVVPILCVIVVALGIMRNMMLESAYNSIQLAQDNAATTVAAEIKTNSLKLTHFLFANDRLALELAEKIAVGTGLERYQNTLKLKELYNFVVAPSSDIVAIHFYTKGGEAISLKDDLALPIDEIKKYSFYEQAQSYPEHTHYGLINAGFTYKAMLTEPSRRAMAISYAPANRTGKDNIEMVCWYTYSSANQIITSYSRTPTQGEMYLIDGEGQILMSPQQDSYQYTLPSDIASYSPGRHHYTENKAQRNVLITPVPGTDWRIVSAVDTDVLLAEFDRVVQLVMLASLVVFVLFISFSVIFLRNIIQPVNTLVTGMQQVEQGDLTVRLLPTGQDEIHALMESFNSMIRRTQDLVAFNELQQKEKMAAEMKALQSQINPHFLVNTLNSIRFTAMVSRFDSIKNMAEALIKILNASFKSPDSVYTIQDEIEMLECYTYLMKIRYSENFDVEWDVDPACLSCGIPRLLIQPLVENAITHGFEEKEEPGTIGLKIAKEGDCIRITVSDDGKGMSPQKVQRLFGEVQVESAVGHGIALANVKRRIVLNYGEGYGLSIRSKKGEGSVFELTIPAQQQEVEANV